MYQRARSHLIEGVVARDACAKKSLFSCHIRSMYRFEKLSPLGAVLALALVGTCAFEHLSSMTMPLTHSCSKMANLSIICLTMLAVALLLGGSWRERSVFEGDFRKSQAVLRLASQILAFGALLLGFTRLMLWATVAVLGKNEIGFVPFSIPLNWQQSASYMSVATATAICLLSISVALITTRTNRRPGHEGFSLAAVMLGWLGVSRYMYGGAPLAVFTDMAMETAIAIIAIGVGLLFFRPDGRLNLLLRSTTPGGVIARRLLPTTILIPPVIGWARLQAQRAGYVGTESGLSLFALANAMVIGSLVWLSALRLDRLEQKRRTVYARLRVSRHLARKHAHLAEAELRARELDVARAERRLHFSEAAPAMMHSIDARGTIVAVSDAWLDKLGYTRAEVLGRASIDFLSGPSRELARTRVLPEFFRTGRCADVEYQMVRKDGQVVDVLLSAVLERDEAGLPLRSLAIMEDVSEQHARQAALEHEQELRSRAELHATETERLLLERDEMMQVLAHEVRQPLNNASAALQGARLALITDSGNVQTRIGPILSAQNVLTSVIASLDNNLAVASLLVSEQAEFADTDIDFLISVVLADLPQQGRDRVRIERMTATRTATFDLSLVRLALRNLLANALAYSIHDSQVVLRVLDSDEPLALVLDVESASSEISASLVPQLFDRGTRGLTPSGRSGGGLGLYIVRRVAELHGGEASLIQNGDGKVTFRLVVPHTFRRSVESGQAFFKDGVHINSSGALKA